MTSSTKTHYTVQLWGSEPKIGKSHFYGSAGHSGHSVQEVFREHVARGLHGGIHSIWEKQNHENENTPEASFNKWVWINRFFLKGRSLSSQILLAAVFFHPVKLNFTENLQCPNNVSPWPEEQSRTCFPTDRAQRQVTCHPGSQASASPFLDLLCKQLQKPEPAS